jgi:hypothetical protein
MQTPIGWAANFVFGGRSVGPSASPLHSCPLPGTPLALLRIVLVFYTKPCFPGNKTNSLDLRKNVKKNPA